MKIKDLDKKKLKGNRKKLYDALHILEKVRHELFKLGIYCMAMISFIFVSLLAVKIYDENEELFNLVNTLMGGFGIWMGILIFMVFLYFILLGILKNDKNWKK